MKRSIILVNILFFCLFYVVMPAVADTKSTVFVSILPQKFFVQQISKDAFNVEVMVPPGASPHTYEPKPSQMRKLAEARIYFTIGVALEDAWLDKFADINPDMNVVKTEAGISKLAMEGRHHHKDGDHDEHHDEHHSEKERESGLDPHIWLSPDLVKKQAETINDSLAQLNPGMGQQFTDNYNQFIKRIDQLDSRLREVLKDKEGMKFMVFHPSWGYFADSYGLEQVAVEIEGKSPKPAHLKQLIKLARGDRINMIFAQPQFSQKSAAVIAKEIDGEVILIDPLGEDWFANMEVVAETLSKALR